MKLRPGMSGDKREAAISGYSGMQMHRFVVKCSVRNRLVARMQNHVPIYLYFEPVTIAHHGTAGIQFKISIKRVILNIRCPVKMENSIRPNCRSATPKDGRCSYEYFRIDATLRDTHRRPKVIISRRKRPIPPGLDSPFLTRVSALS